MVLYLNSRNLATAQVFEIMGFYYIATVILEYPTGVIGDYFSHRISVFWGCFGLALAYLLMSLPGTLWFYVFALFILAIGQTLVSGSDTALLHDVSKDFKKDYSQIKSYGIIVSFLAISIGGFVSAYDLRYPLYLTSAFLLSAGFFVLFAKSENREKLSGNILATAREGLRHAIKKKELLYLMIISSLIGAFFFSFKWLYNPLFLELNLDIKLWGILAGLAVLLIALGTRMYGKFPRANLYLLTAVLSISVLLVGAKAWTLVALLGMFLSHILRGYFETKLTVDINSSIMEGVRASVLSLKSLLIRLGATVFMAGGGYLLGKTSILFLMVLSVVIFLIIGIYPIIKIKGFENKKMVS